MSNRFNPLDEVVAQIELILKQHGNPKLLLLGSYAKGENKYIKNQDGQIESLSDLEFLLFCRKSEVLTKELDTINNHYQRKYGSFFRLDYDFISPSLRVLLLRNRLLFYEGYKFSTIKDWRMDLVVIKPFNYTEANQTVLWRVFTLRKVLRVTNSEELCTYFCARNILDLFLVYVYNYSLKYPSHELRNTYLRKNRAEIDRYLPVHIIENAFSSFNNIKIGQVCYEDFVIVFQGLCDFIKCERVPILPTFRDRLMRKLIGRIEFIKSFKISSEEFLKDLATVVVSPLNDDCDIKFINRYSQLFPYLKNYE